MAIGNHSVIRLSQLALMFVRGWKVMFADGGGKFGSRRGSFVGGKISLPPSFMSLLAE
jgi:hypothetical protein